MDESEFSMEDNQVYYDCEEEIYYDCEEEAAPSPAKDWGNKRKVENFEDHGTTKSRRKRLKSESRCIELAVVPPPDDSAYKEVETERIFTSPDTQYPSNTILCENLEQEQYPQGHPRHPRRSNKTCHFFIRGMVCKKGEQCIFLHDEQIRESYIASQRIRARLELQRAKEEDVTSTPEMLETPFAILVSGLKVLCDLGSPRVTNLFRNFHPGRVKWSSQFTVEERRKLEDRYSLPDVFFRMGFSTVKDQRNAIIQMNGKRIGYKGPRLLVQRYIPEMGQPAERSSENKRSSGDVGVRWILSKAELFHRKIQSEEEERNRNGRLGIVPEESDRMASWMGRSHKDLELDIKWDEYCESKGLEEAPQLVGDEGEEMGRFEKVDSSGMDIYD